jgi:hypothetical protein
MDHAPTNDLTSPSTTNCHYDVFIGAFFAVWMAPTLNPSRRPMKTDNDFDCFLNRTLRLGLVDDRTPWNSGKSRALW